MRKKYKKQSELDKLQNENDFLQKGIESREEAYDTIYREKERQMSVTKQLTYLFIIIDSLDKLTNSDNSPMSRAIKKALNATKAELAQGMLNLPDFNLTNIINGTTYEE
jgi:hypothetical protein